MMVSAKVFAAIISVALLITLISPVVLLWMWIRDWKKGQLW